MTDETLANEVARRGALARAAAPYLRTIFDQIGRGEGISWGSAFVVHVAVPETLREFVGEYLDGKGFTIKHVQGQLSGKAWALVGRKDD